MHIIEFVTFKSFYSEEEAVELSALFDENKIENQIRKISPFVAKVIGGDDLAKEFHIQIKVSDFKKANELLDKLISQNISNVDEDYYLFSFTNEELLEILHKPDEWNNQDVILSHKILKDRGIDVTDREIKEIQLRRYYELAKPEKASSFRIIRGYILAVLFPILGIVLGLVYLNSRTKLPDGNKVVAFDKQTREHARNILIISCIITLVYVIEAVYLHLFNF